MSRNVSPDSVSSKVSALLVHESIIFSNPYTSVMVMVSNLKKKKGHTKKIFKIYAKEDLTSVTRVR
jgi:hypothetical protein